MLVVVHVDDFLMLRKSGDLKSLVADDLQLVHEVTGPCEIAESKFLGRTIRLKPDGIAWDGDSCHSTTFISKLKNEFCSVIRESVSRKKVGFRSVSTTGVKESGFRHGGTICTQTSEIDIGRSPLEIVCSC